jgi:hypothetical protein
MSVLATDSRVARHSPNAVNARILEETLLRLESYQHADTSRIRARIDELRKEWDMERTLEAYAASVVEEAGGICLRLPITLVTRQLACFPDI